MNERYLFRGKSVHTGDWVQGSLCQGTYPCIYNAEFATPENHCVTTVFPQIDPATIGQCTGLRDKNGTLIFEGDIIRDDTGIRGEVFFYGNGSFMFRNEYGVGDFIYEIIRCAGESNNDAEIIGNIHDNPELLEVTHESNT